MAENIIPMFNGKPWVPPTGKELRKAKKRGDIVSIHGTVIENRNLSDRATIVYGSLKQKYQMTDTDYIETTQPEIAEKLGISKSSLERALNELKEEGYLEIRRDGIVDYKYYLNPPGEEE